MRESGYYPAGAEFDPSAPYNEDRYVPHRRFVSVTISFYTDVEGPADMSEESIRESIRDSIESWEKPKKFDIDELEVMDD